MRQSTVQLYCAELRASEFAPERHTEAFNAFCVQMRQRSYGPAETQQAWCWFLVGWNTGGEDAVNKTQEETG